MYKTVFNKRERIMFKHFSRKGHALFACIGREVIVGTLAVATLTYAKADGVSVRTGYVADGPADSTRTVLLGEVDVTASRAPLAAGRVPRIVTVLDGEAIAASAAQSVNDLIKMAAGVDVRQRGPLGAQTDVSIRGGTSEHIAILLDGINICDPQTGHNAFDLPVDISEIERIEIVEGPAGRIYGTSSLLGAINVVTKKASRQADGQTSGRANEATGGASVRIEGGSYGYADAGGSLWRGGKGRWSNHLSGGYTRSDGYLRSARGTLNADYEGGRAFYRGSYDDERVTVSWHAGMSLKSWGSNTFYSTLSDEQFEHTDKYFTAVRAETKGGRFHFLPSIYWNRFQDRYEFYRGQPDRSPYNYHRTDVYGLSLNSWFDWTAGRTAFGAEMRTEDIISTTLGEPLATPVGIGGTGRQYTAGLSRTNMSLYLEHNVVWRRLTLSAGFTAVKNTQSEMPFRLYPGIDASLALGGGFRLYASYNTSLRMPSFTELYYSVDGHKADSRLRPEEMHAVEAGLRYASPEIRATVSVYHHRGRNMIDWIMDTSLGEDAVWTSVNHAKINSTGIEASAEVDFSRLMPAQKVLRRLDVAYCHIDQSQKRTEGVLSRYALEYLRHKVTAGLGLSLPPSLSLNINYRYQLREGSYTDRGGVNRRYRPYSVVGARLSWDKPRYSAYIEADNLLDAEYVDYGNVPQPGRWIVAGARFNFCFR